MGGMLSSLSRTTTQSPQHRQRSSSIASQAGQVSGIRRGSHSFGIEHTLDYASFADDDEIAAPTQLAASAAAAQPEPDVSTSSVFSISTRVEYTALPRDRKQDVFGLVTLQAAAALKVAASSIAGAAAERQPLDIFCVLDVSGSMKGEKIQLLQNAVRFVIGECKSQDRLCIVTFNSNASRPLRVRRMDCSGKDDAIAATLRLAAEGGTKIASGLEAALETAERRRQRNSVSAILLLTDGQDHSSRQSLPALVSRSQRAGCALYTFGFGADHDARLLSDIAEQAQTPFTFVEDVGQIGAAFAGAVGGLSSVVAQRVEIVLDAKVGLKAVHTPFSVTCDGDKTLVQIPDMLAGERRDVLVELSVPEADADETLLLNTWVRYWDLTAGVTVQTPQVSMHTQRPADEPQPELEPDEEVTSQRNRVEVAQTLQQAASHGDAGQFEMAQTLLSSHERRIKRAKKLSPISESLAIELEDARSRMRSQSSWEQGGMAEVRDAMNMHRMQRSTNLSSSSKGMADKKSKQMYCTSTQQLWISKAKASVSSMSSGSG